MGLPAGVFVVEADFVVKDGVEADVFEIGGLLYLAQVAAVTVAERQDGAAGAEHLLPEMREGMGGQRGRSGWFRSVWAWAGTESAVQKYMPRSERILRGYPHDRRSLRSVSDCGQLSTFEGVE